jgi:hypothetical protein
LITSDRDSISQPAKAIKQLALFIVVEADIGFIGVAIDGPVGHSRAALIAAQQ